MEVEFEKIPEMLHPPVLPVEKMCVPLPPLCIYPRQRNIAIRAAAVLTFNMVVAILMAHLDVLFSLDPHTGGLMIEDPLLFLLGAVALCFTGGGKYAITSGKYAITSGK